MREPTPFDLTAVKNVLHSAGESAISGKGHRAVISPTNLLDTRDISARTNEFEWAAVA